MADRYDAKLCDERHRVLDRRLIEGNDHFLRLEAKQDKILWWIIASLISIVAAVVGTWAESKITKAPSTPVSAAVMPASDSIARHYIERKTPESKE